MSRSQIKNLRALPLLAPMNAPFVISTGARTKVENILIEAELEDGTKGYGECAPSAASTQDFNHALGLAAKGLPSLIGLDAARFMRFSDQAEAAYPNAAPTRAGIEMAVLDAWTKQKRIPLWRYFGGASSCIATDVTVTIMPADEAFQAARRILGRGVSTIKIKIGSGVLEDLDRIHGVLKAAPKARLILDANQGYTTTEALEMIIRLRREGVVPILFEQPVPKHDWDALAKVSRDCGVPVAADEAAASVKDVERLIKLRAAQVLNIKFMKFGVRRSMEAALLARKAGLGLMVGGMVESYLAMTCAAHFAAGIGGVDFVDLDTPYWFAKDPMAGIKLKRGGVYDLKPVRAGIGVWPKSMLK